MAMKLHQLGKSQKGQALVELAITLPLLLLLLFGIIEFGRVGHAYLTLNYAAREGARLGITGASDNAILERINQAASSLQEEDLEISLTPPYQQRHSGTEFHVVLDYKLELYLPFPETLITNPLPLQGRSIMRME